MPKVTCPDIECRLQMEKDMHKKVDKAGMWKFAGVLIGVAGIIWTASYTIYSRAQADQRNHIEKNTSKITGVAEKQAQVIIILENLSSGQQKLEDKVDKMADRIIKELKEIRSLQRDATK